MVYNEDIMAVIKVKGEKTDEAISEDEIERDVQIAILNVLRSHELLDDNIHSAAVDKVMVGG